MKKVILILFVFLIIVVLLNKNSVEEIVIPNESIRIRIIANSNSIEDQNLKNKVRRSIQQEMSNLLKDAQTIDDVRSILSDNLEGVKYTVEKALINENKSDTSFNVSFGNNYFPKKVYKGVTYNEGYYESVVIELGKSEGKNWWCVLFPPLCLLDEEDNIEEVEYKSFIKEIIDKYF